MYFVVCIFLSCLVLPGITWGVDDSASGGTGKSNPHLHMESCDICHVASRDDLNSWFTLPSTKKKLKGGVNGLCEGCHKRDFGHGVGKATALNKRSLPLDSSNNITCAITCHNMHLKNPETKMQERYHLRLPDDELCLSCHEK